ncbi:Probable RNA-directed DNA polymerase from transposon BS [Eumeta japonica]|uniref:Probable RNA-directed DNA polymerase from transposon BS n=1 Tax=Eumeta variegata TaxID=151549 RepID=A0A4C1V9W0_EUMVA|nr:Probable RNA-directed DNA polymerase from transposon BS [Eumeta japonica]
MDPLTGIHRRENYWLVLDTRPKPTIKVTEWKRVSTGLEEVDTPAFNNISDIIEITDRHFMFKHENTHSSRRPLRARVPQGSTFSPFLYSAYINNLPRPASGVQLALFSDDIVMYMRGKRAKSIRPHFQKAIDELASWFLTRRIEENPEKSAAIYFKRRKGKSVRLISLGTPFLRIYNAPIPWQYFYKYLGVTLGMNLHFKEHIKRVRKTAIFYQARFNGMLDRKSKFSLHNKRTLHLMCIRTVQTYASPVFVHAVLSKRRKLQVLQSEFSRAATNTHCRNTSQSVSLGSVSYEASPPYYLIRRQRNALTDSPDDFTRPSGSSGVPIGPRVVRARAALPLQPRTRVKLFVFQHHNEADGTVPGATHRLYSTNLRCCGERKNRASPIRHPSANQSPRPQQRWSALAVPIAACDTSCRYASASAQVKGKVLTVVHELNVTAWTTATGWTDGLESHAPPAVAGQSHTSSNVVRRRRVSGGDIR